MEKCHFLSHLEKNMLQYCAHNYEVNWCTFSHVCKLSNLNKPGYFNGKLTFGKVEVDCSCYFILAF